VDIPQLEWTHAAQLLADAGGRSKLGAYANSLTRPRRLVIYQAFIEGELDVPSTWPRGCNSRYFDPQYKEFAPTDDVELFERIFTVGGSRNGKPFRSSGRRPRHSLRWEEETVVNRLIPAPIYPHGRFQDKTVSGFEGYQESIGQAFRPGCGLRLILAMTPAAQPTSSM